jgi:hypothetical protein
MRRTIYSYLVFIAALALMAVEPSAASPILIDNVAQLEDISTNLSGNHVLGANINASGVSFSPIGGSSPFTGILNGDGYTISNLAITVTGANADVGLFADVGGGGQVSNLGLVNASVNGAVPRHQMPMRGRSPESTTGRSPTRMRPGRRRATASLESTSAAW